MEEEKKVSKKKGVFESLKYNIHLDLLKGKWFLYATWKCGDELCDDYVGFSYDCFMQEENTFGTSEIRKEVYKLFDYIDNCQDRFLLQALERMPAYGLIYSEWEADRLLDQTVLLEDFSASDASFFAELQKLDDEEKASKKPLDDLTEPPLSALEPIEVLSYKKVPSMIILNEKVVNTALTRSPDTNDVLVE